MARTFTVAPGPHAPQLAITADDLSFDECEAIRGVVCNNWVDSLDYKMKKHAEPFLQGYRLPWEGAPDGWILIEFWSQNREAIEAWVRHLERRLVELK